MIISDENYLDYMTETVEPWLSKRCTVARIARQNGLEIYCEFYDCDKARGIVLISHGYTETAEKFKEVEWMFLTAGYHVCIIDHCGHGRSYRLVDDPCLVYVDRYERYVNDLSYAAHAACERWKGLPLYLWAHSMGGGIGAALTAAEPDLFEKVILTSPMIRPLTGGIPWGVTKAATGLLCIFGKSKKYIAGHGPYRDDETFETSAATSRPRFDYYNEKRRREPLFQMSGGSYGWLREAVRLNRFLMKKAVKRITCPVLLIQADNETFVSKEEQKCFVAGLKSHRANPDTVRMTLIPGSRHETYSSTDDILEKYWSEITDFL